MIRVTAIVLAAGRGERFKSKTPKLLVEINSKPVIIHTLEALSSHPAIKDMIVVVNPKNAKDIIEKFLKYRIKKIEYVVEGGSRRQDSLGNGLSVVGQRSDLVLIHDAARPFIDRDSISRAISAAKKTGAAIVGVPVKATIKEVSGRIVVKKTLDRERLWEIQTPQVFIRDLIFRAFQKFGNKDVTDDAMLVEKLGRKVSVVMGSYRNIKITTPEDLVLAEAIAGKKR